MIRRHLLIADSNGRPVRLPGDSTNNPNNPVFEPFYTAPVIAQFNSIHVSEETTAQLFVVVYLNNTPVSGPLLLHGGISYNITGDRIVPVGVRRAGEVWLQLSDDAIPGQYSRGDVRPAMRGMQVNVFPLTQVPLYTGGPLSNLWCHPLSAPGAGAPMVSGTATLMSAAATIAYNGFTPANWYWLALAAFNVDNDTQSVVNVRRLTSSVSSTAANLVVISAEINPWDRIGVIAIPSAANPNPALAPATSISFIVEGISTYSRTPAFGYLGVGSSNELT